MFTSPAKTEVVEDRDPETGKIALYRGSNSAFSFSKYPAAIRIVGPDSMPPLPIIINYNDSANTTPSAGLFRFQPGMTPNWKELGNWYRNPLDGKLFVCPRSREYYGNMEEMSFLGRHIHNPSGGRGKLAWAKP